MVTYAGNVLVRKKTKATVHRVGSASLLVRYEARRETESIESRINKLEEQFAYYVQSVLRSRLRLEDIEVMKTLSEASLQNLVTICRLAKQIQEASEER